MARECRERSPRGRVPEPDSLAVGCGRDQLAVRREGDGVDRTRMAAERRQRSSRGQVPEPDGLGELIPCPNLGC